MTTHEPDDKPQTASCGRSPLQPNGVPYPDAIAVTFRRLDEECRMALGGCRPAVQQIAQAVLQDEVIPPEALDPLVEVCGSPSGGRWKEHLVTAWILGCASILPESRSAVIQALLKLLALHDVWPDTLQRCILANLIMSAVLSIPITAVTLMNPLLAWLLGCLLVWPISPLFTARYDASHLKAVRAFTIEALVKRRAVESVEALAAAAVDAPKSRIRQAALRALPAVLPELTTDHYGRLRRDTIQHLCDLLNEDSIELDVVLLTALEKAGTGGAVRRVEYIARQGRTERIRQLAASVLPVLRARQQREQDAARLLRPAEAPLAAQTLLRPAQGVGDTDPNRLLRPADLPQRTDSE